MKVLMINKFLHPNGGSETYIFKLGDCLKSLGHDVQYFGMDHKDRCVGNDADSYMLNMDFHKGSKFSTITYPIKTIYSKEARLKIRKVLEKYNPDVCHINNFNYQLTPSIILEIVKWKKSINKNCKIVATAHDYQFICPNHMCYIPKTRKTCKKCLGGHYINCLKNNCIHNSRVKSLIGSIEAYFWKINGAYKYIDTIICCSRFLKTLLDSNVVLKKKTIMMHNFIDVGNVEVTKKKNYILYFGRYSQEKGIDTLVHVAKELPDIQFVFAGKGPLENILNSTENIKNVGFQNEKNLKKTIKEAKFSICPSQWYENCPFSIMQSISYGTPVLGANIGGIPELIKAGINGELFESGNKEDLKNKILKMFKNTLQYNMGCNQNNFDTPNTYCKKLLKIYSG